MYIYILHIYRKLIYKYKKNWSTMFTDRIILNGRGGEEGLSRQAIQSIKFNLKVYLGTFQSQTVNQVF